MQSSAAKKERAARRKGRFAVHKSSDDADIEHKTPHKKKAHRVRRFSVESVSATAAVNEVCNTVTRRLTVDVCKLPDTRPTVYPLASSSTCLPHFQELRCDTRGSDIDYTWSAPASYHLDKGAPPLDELYAAHARSTEETPDETERIVTRVMLDLVNYCAYEMGDECHTLTPSVPKSRRAIVDDFAAATTLLPTPPSPAVHDAPVDDDDDVVADGQVEHEVWRTVRDLVRQVMLDERDTLRRKANKIKKS